MSGMETTGRAKLRVGSVSFLNAKPLIYGLDGATDLEKAPR